ncbi:MAG: ferrous iron transport protein B [Phycisphaerae bacterium]
MGITTIKIALTGNPNSGKTTIFNALTGAHQHVGNYPGVTVEKKQGHCHVDGIRLEIVDLPGTYSLTAISEEEVVARNYIIEECPQVVVDIVDSSNLERNLYLTVQLMELGAPMVLVLNMFDVATRQNMSIDPDKLSRILGVPVVTTVGHKNKGIHELRQAILDFSRNKSESFQPQIDYGPEIEQAISELEKHLDLPGPVGLRKRWLAIKTLENDPIIVRKVHEYLPENHVIWSSLIQVRQKLQKLYGDTPEILIADKRYGFISGIWQEAVKPGVEFRHDLSDHIDAVLTHPILGLPIFLGLMYLVFSLSFSLAAYPTGWLEKGFSWLGGFVGSFWGPGSEDLLRSLLVDGIIGGVGGVIVFLPNILLLFLAIALLEDTGYMARAAFIMDRFMHRIGLHGKSFIPMLIGFGCSVPAIMGTRILDNKRDRLTTIMIIPLMSCGARLTIYSLFIPAFFAREWQGPVLWLVYVIGIVLAAVLAKVLRVFVLRGESVGLVMELPPYRMPMAQGLLIHTWQRGWMYVRKAGTVILAFSIILWALASFPKPPKNELAGITDPVMKKSAELRYSLVGRIGRGLEPAIKPLGFDWRIGTALVGAIPAKEIFVAQMGIIFSVDDSTGHQNPALSQKLQKNYTPLTAFCVMVFCLISAPCLATIAVTRKETGSWSWALAQFFGLTGLGYMITLIIYQTGTLIMSR